MNVGVVLILDSSDALGISDSLRKERSGSDPHIS